MIGGVSIGSMASDAGGWFDFPSVKTGPLILKARKAGLLAEGDVQPRPRRLARGIVLHMESLPADISRSKAISLSGFGTTDEYVWTETKDRIARRDALSRIVSRDQLAAFHGESLGEAIRMLDVGNAIRVALVTGNDQVCVLEDGHLRVGLTTLDAFQVDMVDFCRAISARLGIERVGPALSRECRMPLQAVAHRTFLRSDLAAIAPPLSFVLTFPQLFGG